MSTSCSYPPGGERNSGIAKDRGLAAALAPCPTRGGRSGISPASWNTRGRPESPSERPLNDAEEIGSGAGHARTRVDVCRTAHREGAALRARGRPQSVTRGRRTPLCGIDTTPDRGRRRGTSRSVHRKFTLLSSAMSLHLKKPEDCSCSIADVVQILERAECRTPRTRLVVRDCGLRSIGFQSEVLRLPPAGVGRPRPGTTHQTATERR